MDKKYIINSQKTNNQKKNIFYKNNQKQNNQKIKMNTIWSIRCPTSLNRK